MAVRPARLEDAHDIARIQATAWQVAYKSLIPDRLLDKMTVARREARWQQILLGEQRRRTLLAEQDGQVVGFASYGPCRDDDVDQKLAGEIYALYVAPGHWRQGHGAALIEQVETLLARQGFAEVTLWVLDNNQQAMRFYESRGYLADGAMKLDEREENVNLLEARYRKALGRPAGDLLRRLHGASLSAGDTERLET